VFWKRKASTPFQEQIEPHLRALYNFALELAGPSDAEDLVHTAVLRALERWDEIAARQHLRMWLFVVLRNAWIDSLRQRGRRGDVSVNDPAASDLGFAIPAAEQTAAEQEWARAIWGALRSLPETYRVPVYLRDVEGFTYREIGEILGCPIGTVMSRLARGRALLRAQLLAQVQERGWQPKRKTGTQGHEL
jgi:RNA polymerase sigma-70 factor (ECF subfamily)